MSKTIETKAGTLTILDEWQEFKYNQHYTFCLVLCVCGKKFKCFLYSLKNRNTNSCGCFKSKKISSIKYKHGHAGTITKLKNIPETTTYNSWSINKNKCKVRESLIEKGIKFCKEWESFENFLNDMGDKPLGYRLSRIDKDGDFEPGNCKWVPVKTRLKK